MANNFSAFFETLVAGAGEYNEAKVSQTALLDAVYKDVKPDAARVGKTIDVYFPDVGPMTAINNGQLTAAVVNPAYTPLVFQTRVGKALQFQDFEQWQTATDLAQKFFDPLYKRCREYLNGQIASLISTTNFSYNTPVQGLVAGEVQRGDQLRAWTKLANAKVPLDEGAKLKLLVHNNVYANMLNDDAWVRENVVGELIASRALTEGKIANAFNFMPVWDQQMPTSSGAVITGSVALTNGSNAVTGTATGFTSQLSTGSILIFGNDPTNTPYSVATVTSDTALTLSTNYTGQTVAATSASTITQLAGTVTTTLGSTTVTGSGTSFTSALAAGQWLTFSGDATSTPYQVLTINSNTNLTLASNIAFGSGSGNASQSATVQSYTSLAMHEYAIALALRPIATPKEAANVVDVAYLDVKGIPLRVMVSYVHIYQALFVTVDFGFAIGVIRPDFGVIIQS